jgi:hypothetical protein
MNQELTAIHQEVLPNLEQARINLIQLLNKKSP